MCQSPTYLPPIESCNKKNSTRLDVLVIIENVEMLTGEFLTFRDAMMPRIMVSEEHVISTDGSIYSSTIII